MPHGKGVVLVSTVIAVLSGCTQREPGGAAASGAREPSGQAPRLKIGGTPVTIEIARSAADRRSGLMFRKSLAPDSGMLFIYPVPEPLTFWMMNTLIPLSIAFFRDDGTILAIHEMKPMQTDETYASGEPCRFALEMTARWFAQHGVKAGDRIEIPDQILKLDAEEDHD